MIMKKISLLLLIFCSILFQTSPVATNDRIYAELEQNTGVIWGFTNYKVQFEVSDTKIAEILQDRDGNSRIRFNRPGDVYVRANFYNTSNIVIDSRLYLFHIKGEAVDETAVNRETFAVEVLRLVNKERLKVGAKPLHLSKSLSKYATVRAKECVKKFSHTRPNGKQGLGIIPKGIYRMVGENLAGGQASPERVVQDWMDSPGHRENILKPEYSEMGVGYVFENNSQYRHYWVQLFGQ